MTAEQNGKNVEIYTVPTTESIPEKKVADQRKFWSIDREMLRFKIHYFLFIGAFGACLPYIPIFAQKRIGISASALSAILTSQRVIFIFTKPSMGYIADYFNKLKGIICTLSVITTVLFFVLLAVPKIEKGAENVTPQNNSTLNKFFNTSEVFVLCKDPQDSSFKPVDVLYFNNQNYNICSESPQNLSEFFKQCLENKPSSFESITYETECIKFVKLNITDVSPSAVLCKVCCQLTEICQKIDYKDEKASTEKVFIKEKYVSEFLSYEFWCFAFLVTISMACSNSLFTLTDTACCESVQKTGSQFGRQRLWAAIGWGLTSPFGGLLNDYTGDFLASWILMAFMSFLSLLNMSKLEMGKPHFSKNLLKDIGTVLSSREVLVFISCVVMIGVGSGILWFYLVLFLTDIGGSRFLCGMVMFAQCFLGEIPFMFYSEWFIKKIGHFNVLTLALAAYCIRFFWYSQLHNPWLVLPAEVLHGFTYGLFYTSVASFAKLSAKPGTEATTQAVLATAHEGIGVGIGCVIAGVGFDSIGGRKTFLYTSFYAGCAMAISIILHFLIRNRNSAPM